MSSLRPAGLGPAALFTLGITLSSPRLFGEERPPNPFGSVARPSQGTAQAIGSYNAGCLAGAATLPLTGPGYRVSRPERRRVFGHPLLIHMIQGLGEQVKKEKLGILAVGDLGQPRGGPTPTGHRSHQNGLDVDLSLTVRGKEAPPDRRARALELASAYPEVERIFVHPTIKRALCKAAPEGEWLHKIRPFWGHLDHFHVRLSCPEGNATCVAQPKVAEGPGCGADLSWWFSEEAKKQPPPAAQAAAESLPKLPPECAALLDREGQEGPKGREP